MFYDYFLNLCNSIGKTPSAVAIELGISKSTVSNWKRRKNGVTDSTALKIANYFGITVDELRSEEKNERSIPKDEAPNSSDPVSDLREAVLSKYPSLTQQQLNNIMDFIDFQIAQQEKQDNKKDQP